MLFRPLVWLLITEHTNAGHHQFSRTSPHANKRVLPATSKPEAHSNCAALAVSIESRGTMVQLIVSSLVPDVQLIEPHLSASFRLAQKYSNNLRDFRHR